MKKKKYIIPEIFVTMFDNEDIITASLPGALSDFGLGSGDDVEVPFEEFIKAASK